MSFLTLSGVKTHFPVHKGFFFPKEIASVKAVDGVDLEITKGEILGLVGESGCGKSTLGRTIMRLAKMTAGQVHLDGVDLHELSEAQLRKARVDFQMIFQDPYASLDPRMTVYDTIAEPILHHSLAPRKELSQRVAALMERVGLAARFMRKYPHEFSGGQRQRIAIARALAVNPKLIIADEPVSALDVSIQSQILNLLVTLTRDLGLTMLFISHDLSVVKHICDRVAVMYLGRIVEIGKTETIFQTPQHPYTHALLSAVPLPDPKKEQTRQHVLLEGDPPSPMFPPEGCRFHPRCPHTRPACLEYEPELESRSDHAVACGRAAELDLKTNSQ